MARFKASEDLNKYIDKIVGMYDETTPLLKQIVYDGADILADAVRSEIQKIPTGKTYMLNEMQKAGLLHGLGIAHMRSSDGKVHTKIGMNGYNLIKTKKHPNGQPNAMIARSLIAGTSFSAKYDFVSKAIGSSRAHAESAMKKKCDELIEKQFND